MLNADKDDKPGRSTRIPTAIAKHLKDSSVGVRFESIGDRNRFRLLLQHFRFEFVLARCEEIDSLKWWIIADSQVDILSDFCRRHGIRLNHASSEHDII